MCEQGLGFVRGQLPAQPARGELGEQPVQPADRLGPLGAEFLAPVAQQPQADQVAVRRDGRMPAPSKAASPTDTASSLSVLRP